MLSLVACFLGLISFVTYGSDYYRILSVWIANTTVEYGWILNYLTIYVFLFSPVIWTVYLVDSKPHLFLLFLLQYKKG